jgi:hypothetical protein
MHATYRHLWLVSLSAAEALQIVHGPSAIVKGHGLSRLRFLGHGPKLLRER